MNNRNLGQYRATAEHIARQLDRLPEPAVSLRDIFDMLAAVKQVCRDTTANEVEAMAKYAAAIKMLDGEKMADYFGRMCDVRDEMIGFDPMDEFYTDDRAAELADRSELRSGQF
jgi:hypothetical protein